MHSGKTLASAKLINEWRRETVLVFRLLEYVRQFSHDRSANRYRLIDKNLLQVAESHRQGPFWRMKASKHVIKLKLENVKCEG